MWQNSGNTLTANCSKKKVFGLPSTIAIFSTSEAEACCVLSLGALETKG